MNHASNKKKSRRGAIVVLAAALMVVVLGYAAFSIDTGYIVLARTQLQAAADASALAAAATMGSDPSVSTQAAVRYAGLNKVGSRNVQMTSSDVVYGSWNTDARTFTPSQSGLGNAVKVTARADAAHGGSVPLFFAKALGRDSVDLAASAVAVANPRDICFVVDLSSSMNDDTDPADTSAIDASFPGVGTQMMQNMFDDFGWGAVPRRFAGDWQASRRNHAGGIDQHHHQPAVEYATTADPHRGWHQLLLHGSRPVSVHSVDVVELPERRRRTPG